MHFMKAKLERPSHLLWLKFTEWIDLWKQPKSCQYLPDEPSLSPHQNVHSLHTTHHHHAGYCHRLRVCQVQPHWALSLPLLPAHSLLILRVSLQSNQLKVSQKNQIHLLDFCSQWLPTTQVLSPITISLAASNQNTYHVLQLSPAIPGQPLVHTSHDLVLPPASTFLFSTYPVFTTVDCTWQYILDRVVNPSSLWVSYSSGSLGDYADVKSIWQAWDEVEYIKDISHRPALQLIDKRWGNLETRRHISESIHLGDPKITTKPTKYSQIFISLFTTFIQRSSLEIALVMWSLTLKIWEALKAWASFIRHCNPRKGNGQQTMVTSFKTDTSNVTVKPE